MLLPTAIVIDNTTSSSSSSSIFSPADEATNVAIMNLTLGINPFFSLYLLDAYCLFNNQWFGH
jgi:hypothetical protein